MSEIFQTKFRVDELSKRVYITPSGQLAPTSFVDSQISFFDALDRPWEYDRLVDMSACPGHITHDETKRLGHYWSLKNVYQTRDIRLAIVTQDPFTIARLPLANLHFQKHILCAFETVVQAEGWLDEVRKPI